MSWELEEVVEAANRVAQRHGLEANVSTGVVHGEGWVWVEFGRLFGRCCPTQVPLIGWDYVGDNGGNTDPRVIGQTGECSGCGVIGDAPQVASGAKPVDLDADELDEQLEAIVANMGLDEAIAEARAEAQAAARKALAEAIDDDIEEGEEREDVDGRYGVCVMGPRSTSNDSDEAIAWVADPATFGPESGADGFTITAADLADLAGVTA